MKISQVIPLVHLKLVEGSGLHDTDWGRREFALQDDQGHTVYVGERRARA